MEYPWGHHRPFNAYAQYFKKLFGERVQKVTIDAGFSCPNRESDRLKGGCTYCNNNAFNPSYCMDTKTVKQQIEEGIEFHANRYRRANKFLAYFQAYSNTNKSLPELKQIYKQALDIPQIAGIVIGTRPDCIDEEKLEYFARLAETHYLIIEYGVESVYDKSLLRINRGHNYDTAVKAIELTKKYDIKTGAHFILGLPGESDDEILKSAEIVSELPLDNIKFHQLQIIKDTKMELEYQSNPEQFRFFELDEYINLMVNFLERLNPNFVVERFAGEVPPRFIAGPNWGLIRNDQILQRIEKTLVERNSWQGKRYK